MTTSSVGFSSALLPFKILLRLSVDFGRAFSFGMDGIEGAEITSFTNSFLMTLIGSATDAAGAGLSNSIFFLIPLDQEQCRRLSKPNLHEPFSSMLTQRKVVDFYWPYNKYRIDLKC